MTSSRAIPAAILAGAAMMSVAVYLGLRDRPQTTIDDPGPPSVHAASKQDAVHSPFDDRERRPPPTDIDPGGSVIVKAVDQPPGRPEESNGSRAAAPTTQSSSQVAQLASAQAAALRDELRSECWDALPARESEPASVDILVNLSFGSDGRVLASGTTENREARRDGVADCVGRKLHTMRIDPPGAHVSVEIPIEVP
jgi:hypothetical protein